MSEDQSSNQESSLIEYFENLLIQNNKTQPDIIQQFEQLNDNESEYICYAFVFTQKLLSWKQWLNDYLQSLKIKHFQLFFFSKPKNQYTIIKILLNSGKGNYYFFAILLAQLLLLETKTYFDQTNQLVCCFRPSFYLKTELQAEQQESKYWWGQVLSQQESEHLEYKSLKADLIIKKPKILLKSICSFLNRAIIKNDEQQTCKIVIGISQDKDIKKFVVSGFYCNDKKIKKVERALQDSLKEIRPRLSGEQVKIEIQKGSVDKYQIENLKIIEISIQLQDRWLYNWQGGKFFYRNEVKSKQIGLSQLYESKKQGKLSESQFIETLEQQDKEIEQMQQQQYKKSRI